MATSHIRETLMTGGNRNVSKNRKSAPSLDVFDPHIAMRDLQNSRTFDFETNESLCLTDRGIVVDKDRHQVPVDNLSDCVSGGNNLPLVPVVDSDITLQRISVSESAQESRLLTGFCFHNLPAPGNFSSPSALLVQIPRKAVNPVEVGLRALHVPLSDSLLTLLLLLKPCLLLGGHRGHASQLLRTRW